MMKIVRAKKTKATSLTQFKSIDTFEKSYDYIITFI